MSKKVAFLMILLFASASLTAFASGEKAPKRVTERFAPVKLDSERVPVNPATYRPLSGTPSEIRVAEVERGKDYCDLTGNPVYAITDWFQGFEWFANYQNPEDFGCVDVWPFQVTEICFQISTDLPVSVTVQGLVFEDAGPPECPMPGEVVLCETPLVEVDIPPGYWEIALPIPPEDTCCVNSPYFAAIYIANDLTGSGADAVSAEDGYECYSYMNRGSGWEDLVHDYVWPGQMMLYSRGFTDPQNPCEVQEEDCDTLPYTGYTSYYWPVPNGFGYDFYNERFDIPYDCYLDAIHISFFDGGSSGSPDAHIYVWESDGMYPLDPAPPAGAIAEFVIPDSEVVWYPQQNVIEIEIIELELTGMQPIHVGYSHPRADVMDTLSVLSDDGYEGSDRSSEYTGDQWLTILDDWGIGVDFFVEIVVCPIEEEEGCCWWYVDGGPETGCVSPVTAAQCADLGGNFISGATCNPVTGRCDVPHTVIVEPNDTSIWDQNYFSDTLTIQAIDFQPTSNVEYTLFEYFDGANWQLIDTDYDGTTYMEGPPEHGPGGDGWQARWFPGSLPEGYYMIRATMYNFDGQSASDTIVQYWDPYPPEVSIIWPGVFNFPTDSLLDIQFYTPGDNIAEMYVVVYPIPIYPSMKGGELDGPKDDCIQGFNKGIPPLNQLELYPNDSTGEWNFGCSPTSLAACLKYWAQNGHPCLTDNGSMTDSQMVAELAGYQGTDPNSGSEMKTKKTALDAYIKKHCGECVFQPAVSLQGRQVNQGRLIRELFEEDEDVIVSDGDHVTVANSFCVHPRFYLDFMDPGGGTEVQSTDFSKGFDGDPLLHMVILSPKEATQPVPTETVATTDEVEPVPDAPPGTYHYPWEWDPTKFPVGRGYFVNVDITDIFGHKGWDLVKIELFVRGDANGDASVGAADIVYLLNYLFRFDIPPFPVDGGDANCDGDVGAADVVYLITYLFRDGPPPGCY